MYIFKRINLIHIVPLFTVLQFSKVFPTVLPPVMVRHPASEVTIVTNSSLPKFNDKSKYFYRRTEFINQAFTLHCEATGLPRYKWTKDNLPLNLTLDNRIEQTPGQGSIIFKTPSDQDIGIYQCFAENDSGTAVSNMANVKKVWIDPIEVTTENATAMEGLPFRLKCHQLRGWPNPEFTWLRNGEPVEDHTLTVDAEGHLWIAFIEVDDYSGDELNKLVDKYTCVAKTLYFSMPVNNVILNSERNLEFSHRYAWRRVHFAYGVQQYVSAKQEIGVRGQSITLYCIYGGMPVPEVKWFHSNELLIEEPQHIKFDSFGKLLRIENLRSEDRGNYTCKVYDESDLDEQPHKTIFLLLHERPVLNKEPHNMNVTEGETAVLSCSASGEPKPDITWYNNGRKLSKRSLHPKWSAINETLTIQQINASDTGNYACNVSNTEGYIYKDVYINVVKAPVSFIPFALTVVALGVAAACVFLIIWIPRKQKKQVNKVLAEDLQLNQPLATPDTISRHDSWHFNRGRLKIIKIIGEGNFDGETQHLVAVKTTLPNAPDNARAEFLREIEITKRVNPHLHVIKIIGSCTEMTPSFLILELLQESLHQYLRRSWREKYYQLPMDNSNRVTSQLLVGFALQIARGMKYISSQGIVHRDLATRNVLLSSDLVCKISDFGLAREINDNEVYMRKSNIPLPIRWMSPESLLIGKTSVKSDVWSFGVLMWELVALGATPYPGKGAHEVKQMVCNGKYMEKPKICQPELYKVMSQCWLMDPNQRVNFKTCIDMLSELLEKNAEYIQLKDFPEEDYFVAECSDGERV